MDTETLQFACIVFFASILIGMAITDAVLKRKEKKMK